MRATAAAWGLAIFAATSAARAEDANRVAAATLLFDEGVKALDAGRLDEACEKLQKSQDLAPSGGTLLALAECQERSEHFASAFVAYRAAAARAHAAGKTEAETGALDHAAKLEPKLAQIIVASPQPDVALVRDGTPMTASELGVAIPVDPGTHELRAVVGGADAWSRTVTVEAGTTTQIDVPPIALPSPKPEQPVPAPPPADRDKTQRTLGVVAAGVGVGALVTSGIFYGFAVHNNNLSKPLCIDHDCTARGLRLNHAANGEAAATTALFIGGAVLLVGGVILYLTAPRASRHVATDLTFHF